MPPPTFSPRRAQIVTSARDRIWSYWRYPYTPAAPNSPSGSIHSIHEISRRAPPPRRGDGLPRPFRAALIELGRSILSDASSSRSVLAMTTSNPNGSVQVIS